MRVPIIRMLNITIVLGALKLGGVNMHIRKYTMLLSDITEVHIYVCIHACIECTVNDQCLLFAFSVHKSGSGAFGC